MLIFSGLIISFVFLLPLSVFPEELPEIGIVISFDMDKKTVEGKSTITFHENEEAMIRTGPLKIKSLAYNGNSIEPSVKAGFFTIRTEKNGVLAIEFECSSGMDNPCVIDKKGIFLTGDWYPSTKGLAFYRLKAMVPEYLAAVSEAEEIEKEKMPGGNLFSFAFPHPLDCVHFIAGRFDVKKEKYKDVELYAYFFPEDSELGDTYLRYTKKYLELYEGMTGRYPYRRFSVVENFLPTGYSMPTFTLLGQEVVKLPLIVTTSLRHEMLHQWFGDFVYVDNEKGNWSEGLTTYLSDHLYEEREGRGWQHRKQILIDYESYVTPDKEFPLREFTSRNDSVSKAIGYGKSAMLFHMLKGFVGDETFFNSLRDLVRDRPFRKTSWDDIRVIFEKRSDSKLDWFFDQWLNEKGYPSFEIKNREIGPKGLRSVISFDVIQAGRIYTFDLPVSVKTDRGETKDVLKISSEKQGFEVVTDGNPESMVFDENYDTFRKLSGEEAPPVIAKLLSDQRGMVVLPARKENDEHTGPAYSGIVELFKRKGYSVKKPEEVKDNEIGESQILILGYDNLVANRLFGKREKLPEGFVLFVKKNPFNPRKVIALAEASSEDEVNDSLQKISNYGKYSRVSFREGRNTEKTVDEGQRGWIMPLRETVTGIEASAAMKLSDIIEKVSDKKIVYVGERHDKYEHHLTELEVMKGLFEKNRIMAVGMEMFPRPSQKALDEYIEGKIDEREFLKTSEYFKNWGLDYNHYKDILRFARDERIPVIALNIRREIVDKVARAGIDSLTEEEKKELPDGMDMTDEEYRERLKEVFGAHNGSQGRNFDNFYQSQIIWDETMAQSIAEYLKENPDRPMVVLVGGGHLIFRSGIPKRTFRRNGMDYAVIINDESLEKGIADFILFPKPVTMVSSPKLMVLLREENGKVRVAGFTEESVAEKAGLKADDIIVALDGEKILSVDDIKIFLFYKKPGGTVTVTVLRKRFLFGEREMRFEVTL